MKNNTNKKGVSRVLTEKFSDENKAKAFYESLVAKGYDKRLMHLYKMPEKKSKFAWYVTYNSINK